MLQLVVSIDVHRSMMVAASVVTVYGMHDMLLSCKHLCADTLVVAVLRASVYRKQCVNPV
jgi:hypothetical protein